MITLKRYLLTLVALLAMTTGAWAENVLYATVDGAVMTLKYGDKPASGAYQFNGDISWSKSFRTNVTTATVDASCKNYAGTTLAYLFTSFTNLTAIEGLTNLNTTSVTITKSMFNGCSAMTSFDLSTWNTAMVTNMNYMFQACTSLTTITVGSGWNTGAVTESIDMFKNCYNLPNFDFSKIDKTNAHTGEGGYLTAAPGTVTLNDTKTTATMAAMPAYDATVSYQLVRDLAAKDDAALTFLGIPTGNGATVKKDGDKYTFATAPTIALEDNISGTAQAITDEGITLSYEKKGEGDTWVAQPDDFDIAIDAVPGTYRVVATATTGLYDGTLYSPEFTLAEAYDLTLSPATDANLQSVTVAGTAKTADENGVIRGIEPTKKVKITTTGPDYIIRKAAVKKTEAGPITVTITQSDFADGASFTKDGVTVAANRITASTGDIESDGSFSTTLGKFTQIVVNSSFVSNASGTGWSGSGQTITWSGTPASTVTFNGSFVGMGQGITIVCTIQPGN